MYGRSERSAYRDRAIARHHVPISTLKIMLQEMLTGFSTRLSHSTFRWIVAFTMESRERD